MLLIRCHCRKILAGLVCLLSTSAVVSADEAAVLLLPEIRQPLTTNVDYRLQIAGDIVTPSASGPQSFPLTSTADFRFQSHTLPGNDGGPFALNAVRRFADAATSTTVGEGHTTAVKLSPSYRSVTVSGSNKGLIVWSPNFALPRKQLDLLQMPFDPLAVRSLLPGNPVKIGDKWNTDAWLVPMLTGIEVVITQSAACELVSVDKAAAVVSFAGEVDGAVQGSASKVKFSGEMTINRRDGFVESFSATQKEKRSPGPVSPGLDVTAAVRWKQTAALDSPLAAVSVASDMPSEQQQHLFLQTPLKLQLRHSREWYLFHETSSVLMLRQLRDGNLVSQCNISTTITVPPKQHTPDAEFRRDVEESVAERKGKIQKEETVRDDGRWRIRHIRAAGDASGTGIVWDYYLCSAATGEQFSIVFSHANNDEKAFGDEAVKLLSTLQVAKPRNAVPFR